MSELGTSSSTHWPPRDAPRIFSSSTSCTELSSDDSSLSTPNFRISLSCGGRGRTEAVTGSLRRRFCRWLELTDLQPGGGSLGLVQQREASLFDDGVGEVQLGRGSRVHDFLHSVSGQKANHFHGSTQREQESKLIRMNYIIVFVYSKQTLI